MFHGQFSKPTQHALEIARDIVLHQSGRAYLSGKSEREKKSRAHWAGVCFCQVALKAEPFFAKSSLLLGSVLDYDQQPKMAGAFSHPANLLGRIAMQAQYQDRPDVPAGEREVDVLMTRIRKLRWIGLDDEAAQLTVALCRLAPNKAAIFGPLDTD